MTDTCDCRRDDVASRISCEAVHALWEAYYGYAGIESGDLCAELGIPIRRMSDESPKFKFDARLDIDNITKGGVRFAIPPIISGDMSAREGLLIYHELGHHFLREGHQFFKDRIYRVHTEFDVQEEVWCDNFALAMLLAFFGWQPFDRMKSAHAFLRYGERTKRPRSDALLAWRIRRETRRPRENRSLPKSSLILLSDLLLTEYEAAI